MWQRMDWQRWGIEREGDETKESKERIGIGA
jgi:hypothetical protein